jgi:hypothetical protein
MNDLAARQNRLLARLDQLMIDREIEAAKLEDFAAQMSAAGVRRPYIDAARRRVADALNRLDKQRLDFIS